MKTGLMAWSDPDWGQTGRWGQDGWSSPPGRGCPHKNSNSTAGAQELIPGRGCGCPAPPFQLYNWRPLQSSQAYGIGQEPLVQRASQLILESVQLNSHSLSRYQSLREQDLFLDKSKHLWWFSRISGEGISGTTLYPAKIIGEVLALL